jgi:hypothetical protein
VFDVSEPGQPSFVENIAVDGSVQAIADDGDRLAVASWTHVALLDRQTYRPIALERTRGPLEQDFGVVIANGHVLAAEWGTGLHVLQYRPGFVAADAWIDEPVYNFRGDEIEAQAVIVRNKGLMPLAVDSISIEDTAYQLSRDELSVAPGEAAFVELTLREPALAVADSSLDIESNDPDQSLIEVPVRVGDQNLLKVGDVLPEAFGFLDLSGSGQVSSLDGQVVILAYFGLF